MENDTPIFPQEIISSILVRLPVKALIRFQCVCKDWKNLFRTPSFIAEHLHHSTRQNPLLIVDSIISEGNPWHIYLLNPEMQIHEFHNTHIIDPLMPGLVYSSNGLLCLKLSDSFCLWNPAIRVVRRVPKSLNNYKYEHFSVGFGFSPIINDYKIVKLFLSGYFVVQGEVYSLRTGLWRKVEVGKLEGVYGLGGEAFPCNGEIFWIGKKKDVEGHYWIVSFDIANEVFTLTPFPTSHQRSYNTLASYENKLAILFPTWIENSESYVIDLWVLEECADPSKGRWNWAKIYTSRPNPYRCIIWPKIIWRNEIVCSVEAFPKYQIEGEEEDYEGKVVLCNLSTDEFNFFDIPICSYSPRILEYVESLVLLDNIHV
ncbi:hypothetical protein QN277_009192 [Acacia crassicarpa]|uniref:F-box domain-containing protein n=1 Tax=Acacia crassicarpa TaxID=499986 RepID=A0AAE1JNE3_9FABA|nr:hypothetical protein QN277_009192 [Acacia crassicarpa]